MMSKDVKKPEVKKEDKPSNKEVLESLKIQLKQYETMALKAQGAIEILEQLQDGDFKEK
jgi:hypothetical protein